MPYLCAYLCPAGSFDSLSNEEIFLWVESTSTIFYLGFLWEKLLQAIPICVCTCVDSALWRQTLRFHFCFIFLHLLAVDGSFFYWSTESSLLFLFILCCHVVFFFYSQTCIPINVSWVVLLLPLTFPIYCNFSWQLPYKWYRFVGVVWVICLKLCFVYCKLILWHYTTYLVSKIRFDLLLPGTVIIVW